MHIKKIRELGRSMVEMLAVLAIIGLLSVAGLTGYKTAMDRIHANELMEMGLNLYAQARAKVLLNPECSGKECYLFWLENETGNSKGRSLGMEKPSWATLDRFNIAVTGTANANVHYLYFYAVGSCDICNSLKSMTEAVSTSAKYRLLPGSKGPDLTSGVRVYCYKGTEEKADAENCWLP